MSRWASGRNGVRPSTPSPQRTASRIFSCSARCSTLGCQVRLLYRHDGRNGDRSQRPSSWIRFWITRFISKSIPCLPAPPAIRGRSKNITLLWPANYDPAAQKQLVTFLDNHDQPRFLSSDRRQQQPGPAQGGAGFSLHVARHSLPLLRHGAGLQRRERPVGPRRHVRRAIRVGTFASATIST